MEPIPLLDLRAELRSLRAELQVAFDEVLDGATFILGPALRQFEAEAAAYLGVKHAIGVNSGTDALVLALRAAGIGPGDEVITTPFTFFATAESISILGAKPVFVDIDPVTFNLDLALVEAACTSRTRAIVPVHLFGNPVDMDRVRLVAEARDLTVVEDAAQAFGSAWRGVPVGRHGAAGAFSFFPSKNLGGLGDGGLVVTDDDTMAETVRKLRTHGSLRKYHNEMLGYNSRLDELQAAFLRVKLPYVDAANEGRRRVASAYGALLEDVSDVVVPSETAGGRHVYHQYTVRLPEPSRDAAVEALADAGVATAVYYPVPVHRLPVYAGCGPDLPVSEAAAATVLSLPIWPTMADESIERVVVALRKALPI